MKTRKAVSIFSSFLIICILLLIPGCANQSNENTTVKSGTGTETTDTKKELDTNTGRPPITIKMFGGGIVEPKKSTDDEVGQLIKEKFNVEFEFIPLNENAGEKAMLMLATNDFGGLDIIQLGREQYIKAFIEAGALKPLDEAIDKYAPNLKKISADILPYWSQYDSKEGKTYIWQMGPDKMAYFQEPFDVLVRSDVLEATGWPELDTTDDWLAFLKEAMDKFPTTDGKNSIGQAFFWGNPGYVKFATYLVRHSGYMHAYKSTVMVDPEEEKFVNLMAHPVTKEALKFYQNMYREGFMDKEAFTDKSEELEKKLQSGVALTVHFSRWSVANANKKLTEAGHPERHYVVMPIRLTSAKTQNKPRYELINSLRGDETRGILKSSKAPTERIVELLDWACTEEAAIRMGWGVQGRDYVIENGKRVVTQEFIELTKNTEEFSKTGINGYNGFLPARYLDVDSNGQARRYQTDVGYQKLSASETQKKVWNQYGWNFSIDAWFKNKNFNMILFDVSKYIASCSMPLNSDELRIEEKITQLCETNIPKMIIAKTDSEFENIYNETISQIEKLGVQKTIDLANEQLKEFEKKIKN